MSIEVNLTVPEIYHAANVGVMRMMNVITKNRQDPLGGRVAEEWTRHIEGACGEFAYAKWSKQLWLPNVGKVGHVPDVGEDDVRMAYQHTHRLIIHDYDPDERKIWLVTGFKGKYRVQGWMWAGEGKQERFIDNPTTKMKPAYFVPQEHMTERV